jgi:hypothetical protein
MNGYRQDLGRPSNVISENQKFEAMQGLRRRSFLFLVARLGYPVGMSIAANTHSVRLIADAEILKFEQDGRPSRVGKPGLAPH